jgi:hypothetical protein
MQYAPTTHSAQRVTFCIAEIYGFFISRAYFFFEKDMHGSFFTPFCSSPRAGTAHGGVSARLRRANIPETNFFSLNKSLF